MGLFDDARMCINKSIVEKYFSVPGSKWVKGEYWTLSPLREDKNIKSGTFSITEKGLWKDLQTGQGGDFIDLICAVYNLSKKKAAEKIIKDSNGRDYVAGENYSSVSNSGSTVKETKKPDKPLGVVIPDDEEVRVKFKSLITNTYNTGFHGTAKKVYTYRNYNQKIILFVCRYEKVTDGEISKQTIPYYYDGNKFHAGKPKNLQIPLYNENLLSDNKKPILIVEGEKCGNVKSENYILISWIGGTGNVDNIDFSILKDRNIVIWGDNDEAGRKAAYKIKEKLPHAEILKIENKPEKWDCADAEHEGISIDDFAKKCLRIRMDMPQTPYDAFIMAIDKIYGVENVEQYEGYFYIYNPKKHYWQMRLQCSIESDLQTWIVENMKQYLDEVEKSVHTFVSNVKSLVKSYQRTYFEINPFKDTALSPYIHVKNGAIEITEEGFIFHSRKEKGENFFRMLYPMNCIDIDFDMKHYENDDIEKTAPMFYKYVNDIIPESAKTNKAEEFLTFDMFSEMIGYTINPRKRNPFFFAFYGKQESGKSFFIQILKTMISDEFFVETPVRNMDSRFGSSSLFGSKVYVDDDFKAGANMPDDFIKAYCGEKTVSIEYKNQNTLRGVKISVAMYFLSNHVFTIQGGPEGIERRFIFLPFRKSIKTPDVYFLDKMTGLRKNNQGVKYDERPAILGFALRGMKLLSDNNHIFTMPAWVREERSQWITNSSSINQFLSEEIYDKKGGFVFDPAQLYKEYKDWCHTQDKKAYGRNSFYEQLRQDSEHFEYFHDKSGNHFRLKGGFI